MLTLRPSSPGVPGFPGSPWKDGNSQKTAKFPYKQQRSTV